MYLICVIILEVVLQLLPGNKLEKVLEESKKVNKFLWEKMKIVLRESKKIKNFFERSQGNKTSWEKGRK